MKKISRYLAILFVVSVPVWMIWFSLLSNEGHFVSHNYNAKNREALKNIHESLIPGMDAEEVLGVYWAHKNRELRLSAESPDHWSINMPVEFFQTNWSLLLNFRQGRLFSVKIRSSEGPKPIGAPNDLINEHTTEADKSININP